MSKEEEMKNILNDLDSSLSQIKKDLMIEYQQKYDSFQNLLEEYDTYNPTKEQWDAFVKIMEKYFEDEYGNEIQHITEVVCNKSDSTIPNKKTIDKNLINTITREEALKLVQEDGSELQNLAEEFKKDKEIVLEAVKQRGFLQYADVSFKKDREIVLEAVRQNGGALHHADDSLKSDPEILAIFYNKDKLN